jgi:hypothetical protein
MSDVSQAELLSRLSYDGETGKFTWRETYGWRAVKGNRAGSQTKSCGYRYIRVNMRLCGEHRLAWIYVNGPIPPKMQIDHINGVRDDNRISNLRVVTNQQNSTNVSIRKNNKSGHHGVTWHATAQKWLAQASWGGKAYHLGLFVDKADAANAARNARLNMGYSERHVNGN